MLELYGLSIEQLCTILSKERKNPIVPQEILSGEIKQSLLKKIDTVFNKGIYYYLDPTPPVKSREASLFFRKTNFNTSPNLETRKRVSQFEDIKHAMEALAVLSEQEIERKLPIYTIDQDAKKVALDIHTMLIKKINRKKRDYLKTIIESLARQNVYVFEFVETWNKNDRVNIDGFYLRPNVIVLKRNQKSLSRELFTLAHELGHHLLDIEEIDNVDITTKPNSLSSTEQWCNVFAFHFLAGTWAGRMLSWPKASEVNQFLQHKVLEMAEATHLSQLAIYTQLLIAKKISFSLYAKIKKGIEDYFAEQRAEELRQKELAKEEGRKLEGRNPKPILSPRYVETLRTAYYAGALSENEFITKLKINPREVDKYLV